MKRLALAIGYVCAATLALEPSRARAWEWFRSESSAVTRGNEHFRAKRYDDAVKSYDEALKQHPDDPGVQLDRGTALLAQKSFGPARDALRSASRGHVDPEIRSRALYNLGRSFLDEADQLSKSENAQEAQARLRESVDAFKAALRAKPGYADAAWNLDLARRRLVELDEEQKKQDEQKKNDDENHDPNPDDDQKNDGQQPPKDGGTDEPRPDGGDDDAPRDGGAGEPKPGDGDEDGGSAAPSAPDQAADGGGGERDGGAAAQGEAGDAGDRGAQAQPAAPSRDAMERALDALREGEESFQKHRAGARARTRPERVLKDW